jgi:putative peptide zinc metalloprotease protein
MNDQAISQGAISRGAVRLAPGVEYLAGPNDTPLLYISESKTYVRLSAGGAEIVRLLTGRGALTAEEISETLARKYQAGGAEIDRRLGNFLRQLGDAGALADQDGATGHPQARPWFWRAARSVVAKPRLKLFSCRFERAIAEGAVASLKARAGGVLGKIAGLGALLALAVVGLAVPRAGVTFGQAQVSLPFIVGGLLLHAVFHELSHALVGSYYGVKVREIGVALLYYFLPVAYTDRTDAYRLRDFDSRAAIALAGPMLDLYATAISAAASRLAGGAAAANFRLLMWLQLGALLSNLNPLMPGDGYHVLEAWLGALNFRRRAFSLLFRRLTFRALPPNLQGLRTEQQLGHIAYAVAALGYTSLLAAIVVYNLGHILAVIGGR